MDAIVAKTFGERRISAHSIYTVEEPVAEWHYGIEGRYQSAQWTYLAD